MDEPPTADQRAAAPDRDARLRVNGQRLDGRAESRTAFLLGKVRRHVEWARRDGLRRLVEEDDLDPRARLARARDKRAWRRAHGVTGQASAVFVVGLQRSGTNMVVRGLERAPEVEAHNENDRAAFSRFRLRSPDVVEALVRGSAHELVLFKPLCDSHDVVDLLARHSRPGHPARAVWVYRDPDGRARSAVAKFGDNDRVVLEAINSGDGSGLWQAQRLSPAVLATLASFDVAALSPESASALFWWARNSLFFDLGLDRRDDVVLVSYRQFVADAAAQLRPVCDLLGFPARPSLVEHVDARAGTTVRREEIDERVRVLCDELEARLDAVAARDLARSPGARADEGTVVHEGD